jgi:uncharacterized phage-associated protein
LIIYSAETKGGITMEQNLVFCEECRQDVPFTTEEKVLYGTIKGVEYSYIGTEARCEKCGSPVYIPALQDRNLTALYDVYRRENNIIPLDTLLAIPEKYAIGKRPLSLLLGWGEQTFSRYCDGDIPSKQYSDILRRIDNDPAFYDQLLEHRKDNLKSISTYEKSKKAVRELLTLPKSDLTKIDISIHYLIDQCQDITPLSLQKALYYIQGFYYAFYRTFLFPEDCEAWVHGPVFRDVYFKYRDYRFDRITETAPFDCSLLTAPEKAIFDSVIQNLCCYSGKILERFTHSEAPWLDARGDLPLSAPSDRIIPKASIGAYFDAIRAQYGMIKPGDIHAYACDMFQHI